MKKSILELIIFACIASITFNGCGTPADHVETAKDNMEKANENLEDANEELVDAKKEYADEVEQYREETGRRIKLHTRHIDDLKAKMKRENKVDNNTKIAALEQRNNDLRNKMNNYKNGSQEDWGNFKLEFNRDMDQLDKDFNDLLNVQTN